MKYDVIITNATNILDVDVGDSLLRFNDVPEKDLEVLTRLALQQKLFIAIIPYKQEDE